MVDVSDKLVTRRTARASACIVMQPETLIAVLNSQTRKGDVLAVARLAGIMGAKRTADLIPLCHPLSLESIELVFEALDAVRLRVEATVLIESKTGAEMEALTAVSVAALTVYDMCKSTDRGMKIQLIQLEEKSGGKSGSYVREEDECGGGTS